MKIVYICYECHCQGEMEQDEKYMQIRDDGRYQIKCKNGHEIVVYIPYPKFIPLWQLGLNALLDGYLREAIANFASSTERFYEFFIKIILSSRKYNDEKISNLWKMVSKQSERQYGMFCVLYLLEFGDIPPKMGEWATFRNNVIHQGYIPKSDEVYKHMEFVYDFIFKTAKGLCEKHQNIVESSMDIMRKKEDSDHFVMAISVPAFIPINSSVDEWVQDTFSQSVEKAKTNVWFANRKSAEYQE